MSIENKKELMQKVDTALETVRPHLAVDGGNVELVDITEDMIAEVKWLGNCESCSMSAMTLRAGLEETLKSTVPEIKGIKAINGVGV